jgi:CheY-like chemotaxis protein
MAKPQRTILVVDDSTVLLDQVGGAFSDAGYEVAHAIDGEEVFRKITAFDPDALLLDVYMPRSTAPTSAGCSRRTPTGRRSSSCS